MLGPMTKDTIPQHIAAALADLGIRVQPAPQPRPDPSKSPGIWYRDGNIPH